MAYCVNVKSKEFISLCKDLNISSGNLALIVYEYLNSFNTDEFPSKEFILNKLQGIPTKMSDALIEVYNKYYSTSKVFDTEQELDKAKTKALLFFNPEAIFSYKNYDGKYVLNIASPDFTEEYNKILLNAPRDSQGRLLAPNGKPSNLTERQYAQVRTKAFKEWFGDWEKLISTVQLNETSHTGTGRTQYYEYKINKNDGYISIAVDTKNKTINITGIEAIKGKGLGVNSYIALQNKFPEYTINSDEDALSVDAERMWDRMVAKGIAIKNGDKKYSLKLPNASKVVDENGEPLVVYHNGAYNIHVFQGDEYGNIYFGDSVTSSSYGGSETQVFLNIKSPIIIEGNNQEIGDITEQLYGTRRISPQGKNDGVIYNHVKDVGEGIYDFDYEDVDRFWSIYEKQGYGTVYSVNNPNQIKSATDNIGAFSTTNDRIDRFTEQLNGTFNYLKSQNVPIKDSFSGNDLTKLFKEFKDTLAKIIETNQKLHHYDLGTIEQPSNRLEDVKNELAYYEYLLNLTNNIIKKLESQGKSVEIIANNNLTSPMSINSSGNIIKLYYNPNLLLRGFSKFDYILAHELVHSVTSNAINNTIDNTATSEELLFSEDIWNIIVDLYNNKQFHWDFGFNLSDKEGRASHIKEFIANVMTNPRLLSRLALIKVDNKNKSLLDRFISAIKNLLNKYLGIDIRDSYLEKLMNTTSLYIENQKTNIGRNMTDSFKEGSATRFTTSKSSNYRERTKENTDWSDVTLALAKDFNTAGEKLTKNVAGKKYVPYELEGAGEHAFDADEILDTIKAKGLPTENIKLNIAGNGIYSLKDWTQEELNDYLTDILQGLLNLGVTIAEIRTGGQTGVDEAGIIAAQRLGIPSEVHTTSDYKFRDKSGKDISNEQAFKARFQQGQISQEEHPIVEIYNGEWSRNEVAKDTESLYIFTDNTDRDSGKTLINPNSKYAKKYGKDKHYPTMTQAVIRGLDNAMPISTQRWYHQGAKGKSGRWTDKDIKEFEKVINSEIADILEEWNTGKYKRIVIADIDGFFNTEISNISMERTPLIYKMLKNKLTKAGIISDIQEEQPVNTSKLQEAADIVDEIKEDSNLHIRRDDTTHIYYIDGKPADSSVTKLIHGNVDLGEWGLPSTTIGSSLDLAARIFFIKGTIIGENIPNMTKEQIANLEEDLIKLRDSLDKKFGGKLGEAYNVVTEEILLAGKYRYLNKEGKPVSITVGGTMDMLIYDKDGNFYIYDFKTKRTPDASKPKEFDSETVEGYYKQLSMYKAILEANYPQLKGKIKELNLIRFDTYYPAPLGENNGEVAYVKYGNNLYYLEDNSSTPKPIQANDSYSAPRLSIINENGIIVASEQALEGEYSSYKDLDRTERELIEEEVGETTVEETVEQTSLDRQISDLYNPGIMSASERQFLGNTAMYYASFIITHLQTSRKASNKYFGNSYMMYNFTSMSRREIIDTIGISTILDYVKETYFNSELREDIEDLEVLNKLDVAYDNWGALTMGAYSKLITLEDTTVVKARPDEVTLEGLYEGAQDIVEGATLEEKEIEYWQLGQRQISARSSIMGEVKRVIERMPIKDANGDYILDKYGYRFMTFMDSGEATNRLLDWCSNCTTIEEMEESLTDLAATNPWLNTLLDKMQKEPFRSLFFHSFRKQYTKYSIITIDRDSEGKVSYNIQVINTKEADKAILEDVVTMYNSGMMQDIITPLKGSLEGKGKVNVKSVTEIKNKVSSLLKTLQDAHSDGDLEETTIKEYTPLINILKILGIPTDTKVLKEAFAKDTKKKNFNNTNIFKILREINNITDTLLDNKDRLDYNPLLKGTEGNIYSNYKSIVNILSNYMFDSIEASTYENGKMYYSYNLPSYLGKLMINLKDSLGNERKFKEFIEKEYGKYRWFKDGNTWNNEWLRQLASSKEARDKLDYKVQLSYDKTDYTELSELSYTLSLIQEYFYDNSNKGDRKLAWYRVPILANKPSSEFIRFTRYSGKHYKEDIKRGLLKVFNQEVMRIKTVLERAINPNINKIGVKEKITYDIKDGIISDKLKNKIKNGTLTVDDFISEGKSLFKGSGAEFKFLDILNNEILAGTELGELIVEKINGVEVNEDTFIDLFNKAIDFYMDKIVTEQLLEWRSLGLYDLNESSKENEKPTFKYLSNLGNTIEVIDDALEEYIWNDMFATINIIELTATDLAYYKNVEDFQKRYAQVHAPSMRLNPSAEVLDGSKYSINGRYSADGMERTIYLQDNISESEIIDNVSRAFDNKIASTSGVEKNYLKMIKSQVLDAFKEVNWADAQGYSSPTSYRKKMGMMGRWDETMEEAYERIVKGNYNINDLQVVWQPFKPFVYSQVSKSSGAKTMSEIKVPIQNKNSEYLLFLADAIMRGDNQYNKLVAIFDFMEDSAYDGRVSDKGKVVKEGTYNGIGIDTVQFVSAVNSGSMGAININNVDTYDEVKQRLHNAVYYNTDKSEVADNAMDRYNDQVVHTIPFEDYGIQQEVPAHFTDHEQLMGSQIRILSISDITPNTSFNINGETITDKELIDEYQNLIAENIRESFNLLIEEFNLKGTRKEKNKALSDLLIKTILKDQRYGSDLLRACSLDANGEFNIPPSDPIHSNRIQQLLNSIIKNRINKQKISGGPVVQASSFGLAEDLKVVYNENGTIKYFECYLPIPSEELERALTRPDGTIMDIEEAIEKGIMTEDMRKAIGYRIPTEDKYSMMPLMIKGFLPKAAGEAVMLPKEITTLSGSDFDIDKMYIMLKSVKYSKEYFDRKAFKSAIRESLKEKGYSDEYINNFIKGNVTEDSVDIYLDKIENGVAFTREDKEGNELEDRKGLALYDAYIANKNRFTKKLESKVIEGTDTREGRNNRIFDLQWAVLTNEDTAIKLFNPGSFDVQKKSARIINVLKSTNKYSYEELSKMSLKQLEELAESGSNRNIIFSGTQVYFHKQNMTAGKLIGIFANNNTSHAFISMQDITLNIEEEFMFNNVPIDNMRNNKLDSLHGKDGALISKTIAGFLAASVDAVKDPVLNAMNLNTFTVNTAMLLVRLGFDSDSIGLFLTQPIIEKVTREYFKRSNEGYVTIDEVIKEFLPEDENLIESIVSNLKNTAFTKRDLAEGIMEGVTDSDFQISALVLFSKLSSMAQDLNSLTFLTKFNSVTNAVGPTIADTFILRDRYERFIDKMESENAPFNANAFKVLDNSPILKAFYETTVADGGASELIFREYFPHYNYSFMYTLEQLKGLIKGNIDAKTINKLVNDFVLYNLTLGDRPVIDSSEKNRLKFIKNFVDFYKKSTNNISNNDLISNIKLKSPDRKCPVPTLEVKTGGYSIDLQEKIRSSWGDLILNPETRQLGKDLFFYNIFRSGFGFSPKTFGHLASVDVRMMIDGYINAIRGNITNESFNTNEFLYQFFRNHVQDYKLVPRLKTAKGVNVSNRTNIKGENVITFASNKWDGLDTIIVKRSVNETTFAPVIIFNNKVYMNPRIFGYSVSYTETTPLGNTNNFLEYGPYGSDMKSVLNTKEDKVDKDKEVPPLEPKKDTVEEIDIKDSIAKKALNIITATEKLSNITLKQLFDKISLEEDKARVYKDLLNQLLEELGITKEDTKAKIVEEQLKNKIKGLC